MAEAPGDGGRLSAARRSLVCPACVGAVAVPRSARHGPRPLLLPPRFWRRLRLNSGSLRRRVALARPLPRPSSAAALLFLAALFSLSSSVSTFFSLAALPAPFSTFFSTRVNPATFVWRLRLRRRRRRRRARRRRGAGRAYGRGAGAAPSGVVAAAADACHVVLVVAVAALGGRGAQGLLVLLDDPAHLLQLDIAGQEVVLLAERAAHAPRPLDAPVHGDRDVSPEELAALECVVEVVLDGLHELALRAPVTLQRERTRSVNWPSRASCIVGREMPSFCLCMARRHFLEGKGEGRVEVRGFCHINYQ